VNWVPNQ